jgi:hypothetical protein
MSRPVIASIHIEQATTFRRKVFFYTDATLEQTVDVSEFDFAMSLYKANYKLDFTINKTNPEDGEIEILLTPTQTQSISTGNYFYDFLARDASNDVTKTLKGIVTVYETGTQLPNV